MNNDPFYGIDPILIDQNTLRIMQEYAELSRKNHEAFMRATFLSFIEQEWPSAQQSPPPGMYSVEEMERRMSAAAFYSPCADIHWTQPDFGYMCHRPMLSECMPEWRDDPTYDMFKRNRNRR